MKPQSTQPLGAILAQAKLVTPAQVEAALTEQTQQPQRRLGEILANNGWVKQQTADFFAERWNIILQQTQQGSPKSLGYYLREAGLLDEQQLKMILSEQEQGRLWLRVGALAVLKGWLNQTTVDFLLEHLYPEKAGDSPFIKPKQ
ncbi:hypothetical protein [Crocosphaera sp. XPORK-15E]|uniref:hypothetical protein n=1 Tax=Crocosphaera sp. XPORK-15E TaxID=3110247 RepID=UPI002B1F58C5|nr:hypothetical protein [Crocosphaera sp. XPORK-15E]MEA5533783.1 hypothetical protein [Crocosphaera sp. XPORK-15E]